MRREARRGVAIALPPCASSESATAVAELFRRFLGLDSVFLGFILPDENMHAPNEFIRVDVFERGVRTYAAFFREQAR